MTAINRGFSFFVAFSNSQTWKRLTGSTFFNFILVSLYVYAPDHSNHHFAFIGPSKRWSWWRQCFDWTDWGGEVARECSCFKSPSGAYQHISKAEFLGIRDNVEGHKAQYVWMGRCRNCLSSPKSRINKFKHLIPLSDFTTKLLIKWRRAILGETSRRFWKRSFGIHILGRLRHSGAIMFLPIFLYGIYIWYGI